MTPEAAPTTAGNAKTMESSETSGGPVRYFNGELQFAADDVTAGGFGNAWGHTRIYSNRLTSDYDFGNGFNWLVRQWAYLVQQGTTIVVMRGTRSTLWFDLVGGVYVPRYGDKHTLVHSGSVFTLAAPNGTTTNFNDFTQNTNPQGSFASQTVSGGQVIQVTSYHGQQIGETQRSSTSGGTTTVESFLYTYTGNDFQTVLLRRQVNGGAWTNVSQANYTYYGSGDQNGSPGDLQTVTTQNWTNGAWQTTGTSYYRYWGGASSSSGSSGGPFGAAHLLKFAFNPDAYDKLSAAVSNPFTASDAQVAPFADYYFEFDSQRHVTKEATQGGQYIYTYAFTTNGNAGYFDDYNNWKMKTVENRPDGSTNTVYTNYVGQTMLKQLSGTGGPWTEYSLFDGNANLLQYCYPSSVAGFDDTQNNLGVALNAASGLIRTYTYFGTGSSRSSSSSSSSSSTAGVAAPGYLASESVQEGSGGTPVLLKQYQYTSNSAGGVTIYPLLLQTSFMDDLATQPMTTSFSYAFYAGTNAVSQRTTIWPIITTAQQGSNTANSRSEQFDQWSNLTQLTDERSVETDYVVDVVTGAITQRTDDAAGLALVTDFQIDSLGRTTQVLGPSHTVDLGGTATTVRTATWTVYQDAINQIWTAQGYATGTSPNYTYTLVNPASITIFDQDGRTTDEISAIRSSTSGALSPTDSFPQSSYCRWTHNVYNDAGQLTATQVYYSIPASGSGSQGVNFNETDFGYDAMGRQNRTVAGGGTITRTVHDPRNLVLSVYVGTDDIGATDGDPTGGGATGNNMRPVQINEYDGTLAGGDGNLTQQNLPADSTTNRIWTFAYDWRDRQTQVNAPQDYYVVNTFNTLDLVTEVQQFASASPNYLINQTQTFYDNLARVYQTIRYAVDPTSGTVGNSLTDKTWFDPAGNVIKQRPGGSQVFIKSVFDNLNRQITQYMGYDYNSSETNYSSASSVTDDTIVEQVETAYDQASNVLQTTTRQRFHNATGTGALTSPSGSQPKARVTYVAVYPDAIGRTQAVADYGTNGDTTLSRSATIPARADTVLVSSTFYNSRGEAFQSTDPAGLVSQLTFDDAGRKTQLVVNPTGSSSSSSSSSSSTNLPVSDDQNNTTLWSYTADDLIATVTAVNAATGNQVTTYNYGTLLANSDNIARNDLVISVVYPDSSSDKVSYLYNRQSQVKQLKDQRGVVHVYEFDSLGRLIHDRVTSFTGSSSSSSGGGSQVDASVQRIERTYEVRGMLATVTNFDNPTVGSGNIVTQITLAYNDFLQLATETDFYALVGSSVSTRYTYADGSGGTIRRLTMTYPSGRVLSFKYGTSSSMADALSRPQYLLDNDGVTHLGDYTYLGLSTIVQVAFAQPGVTWSLINGTGADPYTGLDQFNRVVDNRWFSTGSSSSSSSSSSPGGADLDRVQHGYDRASNRLWRRNTVADAASANLDELYAYDGLERLAEVQRGQLNDSNNGIVSGTQTLFQAWGLDATGNWNAIQQQDNVYGNTSDTQTHNKVNEITFSANRGPVAYDAAGNMTILAVTFANQVGVTYDAWNRAASVAGQPCVYDGLGRLCVYADNENYYYSDSWQLIEQREGTSTTYERQWVWGLRYIDDLVLRDSGDFTPNRLYAMQDANWNVTGIVDTTGTVQERYAYDGYGMPFFMNGYFFLINDGVSSNFGWETLFAGYRYNSAYLYLVRNRWYGPFIGRWLMRDLKAIRDATDLYEYVGAAPLSLTDPVGLAPMAVFDRNLENNKPGVGELVYVFSGLTPGQEYIQLFTTSLSFECFDDRGETESGLLYQISGADLISAQRPARFTDRHGVNVQSYCAVPLVKCCKKGEWTLTMDFKVYETTFPPIDLADRQKGSRVLDAYITAYDCDGTIPLNAPINDLGGGGIAWTLFRLKYNIRLGKQVLSVTNSASGTFTRDGAGNCKITVTNGPTTPDYK